MEHSSRQLYRAVDSALRIAGIDSARSELRSGVYLALGSGVVPWLAMAVIGRGRPYNLGLRRPNAVGWRSAAVGYLISIPFLVWMVSGAGFRDIYLRQLSRAGFSAFTIYYVVNMLTEHFFFHGVLLALFRRDRRWPAPAPVVTSKLACQDSTNSLTRALQYIGLAQPTAMCIGTDPSPTSKLARQRERGVLVRRVTSWIGLQSGCVPAVLASAALFALVHVGKDWRELLLSVPGGIVLAYMAYRTNTWLVPFVLHLATAGTACAMAILMER
jgi:hypothetical protein